MSTPAENAPALPSKIIIDTSARDSISTIACRNSSAIERSITLRDPLLRKMRATGALIATLSRVVETVGTFVADLYLGFSKY